MLGRFRRYLKNYLYQIILGHDKQNSDFEDWELLTASDKLGLFLDTEDYDPDANPDDLKYLLSQTLAALAGKGKDESDLFNKDFPRRDNQIDGKLVPINSNLTEKQQALQTLLNSIDPKYHRALWWMNQNVGNSALAFLIKSLQQDNKQIILNGSQVDACMALLRSKEFSSVLIKEDKKITMRYNLPLMMIAKDIPPQAEDLSTVAPDAMMQSILTIDTEKQEDDPTRVSYEFVLESKNPQLLLMLSGLTNFEEKYNKQYPEFSSPCVQEELVDGEWLSLRLI